jgi:hypothetical protein
MRVVQTADSGDPGALRDAARHGRAAAMSRRRALAAGRSALAPARERVQTGSGEAELRAPAAAVGPTPPTASNGRAVSMQRRRQLSQGKQALNSGGDRTSATAVAGAPSLIVLPGGAR